MALIKTDEEIKILEEGGRRLADVLDILTKSAVPGVTTGEIDKIAEREIRKNGDTPSFLGYIPQGGKHPYPASVCISVNEEVVHGIPGERVLKDGDIVGFDLGVTHKGLIVDSAITVPIGDINSEYIKLISVTKSALEIGIVASREGHNVGAIGNAISNYVIKKGYGLVRELGGHGVGHVVHEEPFVANFGKKTDGIKLQRGMVIAIEPMCTMGRGDVKTHSDGYTILTVDSSRSAHFEHTIAITSGDPIVLTKGHN